MKVQRLARCLKIYSERRCQYPAGQDYKSAYCGIRQATEREKVYTFLLSPSVKELRSMAADAKMKQTSVKNLVINYLLLNGQKAVSRGEGEWDGFFHGRYHKFRSTPGNMSKALRVAPTDSQIQAYAPDDVDTVRTVAGTSSHEFTRLVGILTEHNEARNAPYSLEPCPKTLGTSLNGQHSRSSSGLCKNHLPTYAT